MNEQHYKQADLEQLLRQQPLPEPPAEFAADLMARLEGEAPPRPLWQHPWLQWAAVGLGLGFGLVRLAGYVFGAWLALASAL